MSADPVTQFNADFQREALASNERYELACTFYRQEMAKATFSDIMEAIWGCNDEVSGTIETAFQKQQVNTFFMTIDEEVRKYEWRWACDRANMEHHEHTRPDFKG